MSSSAARFGRWEAFVRTIVIDPHGDDGVVADPRLRAHQRYGARHGGFVLVRPDGYVACTAPLARPEILEQYRDRTLLTPIPRIRRERTVPLAHRSGG